MDNKNGQKTLKIYNIFEVEQLRKLIKAI